MKKLLAYLRLMRPANIVTAVADILAGIAIAGYLSQDNDTYTPILLLILSTIGLYGGGVVMNDVFDADLDAKERPERPIPSGLVRESEGAILGILLLVAGVAVAFQLSTMSGSIALLIALAALVYDKFGKHHRFLGPINMGLCRGLNLLLGISVVQPLVSEYWYLGVVPVIYIGAITMISQGEVHGGNKSTLYLAAALYGIAMLSVLYASVVRNEELVTIIFIGLWAVMVFLPLKAAVRNPEGRMIGRAVKAGVLALILMNAAWAAAFGAWYMALIIVLLLPLSILLAKVFAVT